MNSKKIGFIDVASYERENTAIELWSLNRNHNHCHLCSLYYTMASLSLWQPHPQQKKRLPKDGEVTVSRITTRRQTAFIAAIVLLIKLDQSLIAHSVSMPDIAIATRWS